MNEKETREGSETAKSRFSVKEGASLWRLIEKTENWVRCLHRDPPVLHNSIQEKTVPIRNPRQRA
jgi:hypothetical protein